MTSRMKSFHEKPYEKFRRDDSNRREAFPDRAIPANLRLFPWPIPFRSASQLAPTVPRH
jgi:hypothetical protein